MIDHYTTGLCCLPNYSIMRYNIFALHLSIKGADVSLITSLPVGFREAMGDKPVHQVYLELMDFQAYVWLVEVS